MPSTVLVVDDDVELTELLSQYLESEGFLVTTVHQGREAIQEACSHQFDAIVLDVMLPGLNGFEVLKAIREHKQTPVLMLTARGDDVDKIVALEIGADDYLPKPCNPRVLVARLRAILRRTGPTSQDNRLAKQSHLIVDFSQRFVHRKGQFLDLTNAEFNILEILIKSPGKAFSKEELTKLALNKKFTAFDRSIDVHISNLRNKLGNNDRDEPWVKTVRGFGYLFNA